METREPREIRQPENRGFLRRVEPLVKWAPKSAVIASLLSLAVFANACGGGGSETSQSPVEPTVRPPTAEAQVGSPTEEISTVIPVKTAESTGQTEPTEEIPKPTEPRSSTPIVQETPTIPAVQTTETTSPSIGGNREWTEENLREVITVDPNIVGSSQFRTIEEDVAIISQVLKRFPKIEELKIDLTSGSVSKTVFFAPPQPVTVYIGRDVFLLDEKIADELGSVFDIELNADRLASYYTQEQLEDLRRIREEIVLKYQNFPSIMEMFSPEKLGDTPLGKITNYPDALWIGQNTIEDDSQSLRYPLNEPLFAPYLDGILIEQFAQETEGQINNYVNFGQFAHGENKKLIQLKGSSPYYKIGLETLEAKSATLSNWQWTAGQPVMLDSKYLNKYWREVVPTWTNLGLTVAYAEKNPELLSLLTAEQLQELDNNYQILNKVTTAELFARAYRAFLVLGVNDEELMAYHNQIWGIVPQT